MADEKTAENTSPEESLQQAMEHARAINEAAPRASFSVPKLV
jgi:hypothetical protein